MFNAGDRRYSLCHAQRRLSSNWRSPSYSRSSEALAENTIRRSGRKWAYGPAKADRCGKKFDHMPSDVMVAGHIALDILPDMSTLKPQEVIGAGKVFEIGRITYSTGGAVSNTGLALHRLGIDVDLHLQSSARTGWAGR